VSRLGAIQAQDYAGAKWAIAMRTPNATDASIERALDEGSIIRTHVLRPTWHFVRPEDLRWMLVLTSPRIRQIMSSSNRQLGFDAAVFRRLNKALVKSLEGGRAITRPEIYKVIERARINVSGNQRLGHLLMNAELDCVICSGPRQGKQSTYALVDERIPSVAAFSRDESLARLAAIYFTTRGPATEHDFSWWSGLTVADARLAIKMISRELEKVDVDGRSYWMGVRSREPVQESSAHFLPNYDEFFIAYRDRSALAQRLIKSGHAERTDNLFTHIAIANGQLVGTWKRVSLKKGKSIELVALTGLTRKERAGFKDNAKRYSEFLQESVEF